MVGNVPYLPPPIFFFFFARTLTTPHDKKPDINIKNVQVITINTENWVFLQVRI